MIQETFIQVFLKIINRLIIIILMNGVKVVISMMEIGIQRAKDMDMELVYIKVESNM